MAYRFRFSRKQIADAIRATLDEYVRGKVVRCAFDVGSGSCEEFAGDVLEKLHGFSGWQVRERDGNAQSLGSEDLLEDDGVADLAKWRRVGAHIPLRIERRELLSLLADPHVWIYDLETKLHHDAEMPNGVKNPLDLPFFARKMKFAIEHPGVVGQDRFGFGGAPGRSAGQRKKLTAAEERNMLRGTMKQVIIQEGLEATNVHDATEMYAWDLGYQGRQLPAWLIQLGKIERVDVEKEWRSGVAAAAE